MFSLYNWSAWRTSQNKLQYLLGAVLSQSAEQEKQFLSFHQGFYC